MNHRSGFCGAGLAAVALVIALLGLAGCSSPSPSQELAAAEQAMREVARDSTRAPQASQLLEAFLRQHPRDAEAPRALKLLAVLRQQLGDMSSSISYYQRILDEFPDSGVASEAQFMIGFICEEHLGDYDGARRAYQLVIDNYPDSDLAASARQLLPHVGQPAEEWMRFQEGDAQSP